MTPFTSALLAARPALLRYARRLDRRDPEDLVQETLARALARQATFAPGTDARAWLFTIMHNLHASRMRDLPRRPLDGALYFDPDRDATPATYGDPELPLRVRDLAAALQALPPTYQAILHATAIDGLSYQNIAVAQRIPLDTVRSRLSRARAILRSLR